MPNASPDRSPFDPSRFVFEESSKRDQGKAVHFLSGEASFSERAPHRINRNPQRQRHNPRSLIPPGRNLPSPTFLSIILALLLAVAAIYVPPAHDSTWMRGLANVRKRIFVAFEAPGAERLSSPVCATSSDTLRQAVQEAIVSACWGPALRPDYALAANGGQIVPALTSPTADRSRQRSTPQRSTPQRSTSQRPLQPHAPGPEAVIDEDTSIGHCWAISRSGQVGLSTPAVIHPTHVTIEHVPRQISVDIGRAPRHMVLWGVVDGLTNIQQLGWLHDNPDMQLPPDAPFRARFAPPISATYAFVALTAFEYDLSSDLPIQTFAVYDRIIASQMDFGIFVLEVVDNWGAVDTCLYRIQLHGKPAALEVDKER